MNNLNKLTPIDWPINSRQKNIFWAYPDELIIENDMIHKGYAMLIPESNINFNQCFTKTACSHIVEIKMTLYGKGIVFWYIIREDIKRKFVNENCKLHIIFS